MQSRVLALVIGACVCVVGCGETFSPVVQADPGGLFEPVPDWQGPESSGDPRSDSAVGEGAADPRLPVQQGQTEEHHDGRPAGRPVGRRYVQF